MTNEKIGSFIAAMRKERNMTQEQLAEKLGVSNRSVSRWENGKTLPDLSLMEVICGELGVSMSELLRGEKEAQTMEVKETVVLMASLAHREREKKAREVNQCLIPGFLLLTLVLGFNGIGSVGPGRTILIFAGLGLLLAAIVRNSQKRQITERGLDVLAAKEKDVRMTTGEEMIQFVRKYQKEEQKQHRQAFEAIEKVLKDGEYGIFSMTGEGYRFDANPGPWHVALVVTDQRLLLCGESVRGRLMTSYIPEWLERKEIQSVICTERKIIIHTQAHTLTIEGADLLPMAEKLKKVLGV